jgi:rSAM/selenodomain-associated transferase 1
MLQRQMTEHTLKTVASFIKDYPVTVEIHYDGASLGQMIAWLGQGRLYTAQDKGDIGMRMARAFDLAFRTGVKQAVLTGTDCPGICPAILKTAFTSLNVNDLVLGPARDGGYYLIGLRRMVQEIFEGIAWGTDQVLTQTLDVVKKLGLQYSLLDLLDDIDRDDDLPVWERIKNDAS